jgi:hypothetical protein
VDAVTGDSKLTGREGVAQSSQSGAPRPTPTVPAAPKADPRDLGPLLRELNLTEDDAAEPDLP